jgi:hypothetical protein
MNRSEIDLFQNGYGVYYEATSPEEAAYTSFCPESPARDSGRTYTYGFDFYSQAIANEQFHLVKHPTSIWFNFEEDNPGDNLIYNGIEVSHVGAGVRISISMYYN